MAKKSNIEDLKAGLTFGNSQSVEEPGEEKVVVPEANKETVQQAEQAPVATGESSAGANADAQQEREEPVPGSGQSLAEIYSKKFQPVVEKRTERIQIVVTPTIAKKLDDLVSGEKIKSKNDLINFLLEGYLDNIQ